MRGIGKPERVTQDRVIALFKNERGYTYLGDWADRADNSEAPKAGPTRVMR